MRKKKKIRLKKQAYYLLAGIVVLIVAIILGINFYNDYQYRKTDEYKLTNIGYSLEDTNLLLDTLSKETIDSLINTEKNETIVGLVKEKYFMEKNLDRYLSYIEEEEEENLTDVVAIVNVNADHKWYEEEFQTDTSLNELMNVNKFYALSEEYTPENLVSIPLQYSYGEQGSNKLIDYAYEKFIDMWQAAHDEGYYLMVESSYRDYASQKEIYDSRKASQGERKADETAARPGHSEHQTGLVIDMTSTTAPLGTEFGDSEEYLWLKEHAHEYGFIERYPEGKTYLTGYSPESWHWRYVGVEAATVIHEENITYDEYYAFYIAK